PIIFYVSVLPIPPPPRSTLFPYTTLFRSLEILKTIYVIRLHVFRHISGLITIHIQHSNNRDVLCMQPYFHTLQQGIACSYNDQRSEEHTSELQSRFDLVCRLLLEKKK